MKKEVLFVLTSGYADWEAAFLAAVLHDGINGDAPKHQVKTLALSNEPVLSTGGFRTLPDYTIDNPPDDYDALILVGSKAWRSEEVKQLLPLVQKTIKHKRVLGAICDATVFLGMNGFLNTQTHTSNTLAVLKAAAGGHYQGEERYIHEQAVRDGTLVTGNGTAYLEFAKEVLLALQATTEESINLFYDFYKLGYYGITQKMGADIPEPFK